MPAPDLKHIQSLWQLQNIQSLTSTFSSDLYTAQYQGASAVIKIIRPESDEHDCAQTLEYFNGKGAVRLLRTHENILLLEYLDTQPSLKRMVEQGDDDEATNIIASVVADLHAPRRAPPPANTRTLRRHLRSLFTKAAQEPASLYGRAAALAEQLLHGEQEVRLLHGDIHHENIMHSERGWLAIDPKGLIGERTYEVANSLCNPDKMPAIVHSKKRILRQADMFASLLKLDKERILAFAFVHSCASMCWSIEDGQDTSYAMASSTLLESCLKS